MTMQEIVESISRLSSMGNEIKFKEEINKLFMELSSRVDSLEEKLNSLSMKKGKKSD
jgi:uncharacterized coiled-coil DUF342 family protein